MNKFNKIIDLHTHSYFSDGSHSPTELAALAKDAGLSAIALTDHDTVNGLYEAVQAGSALGLEVVAGVELAAEYLNDEIHILGYFIDYNSRYFTGKLSELSQIRAERNERLIKRLNSLNMRVSREDLIGVSGGKSITRLHFARALASGGYVKTPAEAFERYLDPGCPAYVGRNTFDYKECIDIIKNSGGVPVLAHPFSYKRLGGDVFNMLKSVRDAGIIGIEAIYPAYDAPQTARLIKYAGSMGLKITGGSDFHGENRPGVKLGMLEVDYKILESLRGKG